MKEVKVVSLIKYLFPILLFILSCSDKTSTDNEFIKTDHSLISSTRIIEYYTNQEYENLISKLRDPTRKEKAQFWYQYAEITRQLTKDIYYKLDSCYKILSNSNFEEIKSLIIKNIENYKATIFRINPEIAKSLKDDILLIFDSGYFDEFKNIDFVTSYINRIHNSISIIENKFVSFCNFQTSPGCILTYDRFAVLVGQNSKHFKIGDELEITAGIGSYSKPSQPKVKIGNINVTVNDIGYAEYKRIITDKPGKYSIPLEIKYYTPDGLSKESVYNVEYIVD